MYKKKKRWHILNNKCHLGRVCRENDVADGENVCFIYGMHDFILL